MFLTAFAFLNLIHGNNEILICSVTEAVSNWALEYLEYGSVTFFCRLVTFYCLMLLNVPQRWKCKMLLEIALQWKACLSWRLLRVNEWAWPVERGDLVIIWMDFTLCAFRLSLYFYSTCFLVPVYKMIYVKGLKVSSVILRGAENFLSNAFTTGLTSIPLKWAVKLLPVLKCWKLNSTFWAEPCWVPWCWDFFFVLLKILLLCCWKIHQHYAEEGALGQCHRLRQG